MGRYPGDDGCWTFLLERDAAVHSSDERLGLKGGPGAVLGGVSPGRWGRGVSPGWRAPGEGKRSVKGDARDRRPWVYATGVRERAAVADEHAHGGTSLGCWPGGTVPLADGTGSGSADTIASCPPPLPSSAFLLSARLLRASGFRSPESAGGCRAGPGRTRPCWA